MEGVNSMLQNLLYRFTNRLPCRIIDGPDGQPYLERYYLFGVGGWHCYVHRFVGSDPDRGLHDHPWNRAFSLILSGGYRELRFVDADMQRQATRRYRAGGVNRLRGDDFHRVLLDSGKQAWTLFCHGPRIKGWGFIIDGDYVAFAEDGNDSRHRNWWLTAPSGREVRAAVGEPAV